MSEAHERVVLDVRNSAFTSSVHIDADTSMSVAAVKDRISEYVRSQRCAQDGWPQASGIRCIYRGTILSNDTKLDALHNNGEPIAIHAVVQPDAWMKWPEPAPHAPHRAQPEPSEAHSEATRGAAQPPQQAMPQASTPLATLKAMPRADHPSLLSAVYLTLEAYHAYYLQVCKCLDREPRTVEPMALHTRKDDEAALRVEAIELIETQIMHWTPLRTECEKACGEPSYSHKTHYEHVVLHGLPFVLRTTKRVASHATEGFLPQLESRITALLSLYLQFYTHCTEHGTQAQREQSESRSIGLSLYAHVTREDWVSLGWYLLSLCWRVGLAMFIFAPDSFFDYPVLLALATICFITAASMWHMYTRLRERVPGAARQGAQTQREASSVTSSGPPPAPPAASARTLEIPLLPQRIPTVAPSQWEYWLQRIAWAGLQQEEEAMGFQHVPPSEPLRITWQPCAWPPREPMQTRITSPPPHWIRSFLQSLWIFCMTLEPEIDKQRADAIRLREDAICSLARKWKALQEEDEALKHTMPPILAHPYARSVLIQEARRAASA